MKIRNYSKYTQRDYISSIKNWLSFTKQKGIATTNMEYLDVFLQKRSVCKRTLNHDLSALRTFFNFANEQYNIQAEQKLNDISPKFESKLPQFFTIDQIEKLLNAPDELWQNGKLTEFIWRRDKAILELLYGSGIRVGELVALKCTDVVWDDKLMRVFGKGNKERIIPFGEPAMQALQSLHSIINTDVLIPSKNGKKLSTRSIEIIIKKYLRFAKLSITMTPHSCRHSYATHMLQNGADLRTVQKLLGHTNLSTTQKYTHLNIQFLQKIYNKAHPQK